MDAFVYGLTLGVRRGDFNLVHTCFERIWSDTWLRKRLIHQFPLLAASEVPFYISVALTRQANPEKQKIEHWLLKAAQFPKNPDARALLCLVQKEQWLRSYDIEDFPELDAAFRFYDLYQAAGIFQCLEIFFELLTESRDLTRRESKVLYALDDRIRQPGNSQDRLVLFFAMLLIGSRGLDSVMPFVMDTKLKKRKLKRIKLPWFVVSNGLRNQIVSETSQTLAIENSKAGGVWVRHTEEIVGELRTVDLTATECSLLDSKWYEVYRQLMITDKKTTPATSKRYWREHAEKAFRQAKKRLREQKRR